MEKYYLERLKLEIENKLKFIPRTKRDFRRVSDVIYSESKILISVSTIYRLWGYVKGNNEFTKTTLNILCSFVGITGWDKHCRKVDKMHYESIETSKNYYVKFKAMILVIYLDDNNYCKKIEFITNNKCYIVLFEDIIIKKDGGEEEIRKSATD